MSKFLGWFRSARGISLLVVWAGSALAVGGTASIDLVQFGDVAATKKKAEAGDVRAQLALADCLAKNQRFAEALDWYRQAAERGHCEARFRAGDLLLFGNATGSADQRVAPSPKEGVFWTYQAATNSHVGACLNMSRALQRGLGVGTNLVEAYAWLHLFAASNVTAVRPEMNRLALNLESREIQAAQAQAFQFRHRRWPPLVIIEEKPELPAAPVSVVLPLKINGITLGGRGSLATINRITLAEGESAKVPINGGGVDIQCLKIEEGSVLIQVEGEARPRLLTLN